MTLDGLQKYAEVTLRLGLGIVLVWLGILKFVSDTVSRAFADAGFTFMDPHTFAIVLGIIELLIGVMLIIGLLMRVTASFAALLFLMYIIAVMAWGSRTPVYIALFACALTLVIKGSGECSLDHLLKA